MRVSMIFAGFATVMMASAAAIPQPAAVAVPEPAVRERGLLGDMLGECREA